MSKRSIEVLTTGLDELAVVQAWIGLRLGPAMPDRVEVLRRKQKSIACRLVGVGPGRSDIIAKNCLRDSAIVERQIYAHVLPHLPLTRLRFYAFVDAPDTEFCWLFLEDARGEEFAPGNPEHRELATRWLAGLHTGSAALAGASELPDRGTGYYLGEMLAARRTMRENYDNPALSPADREVLDQMLRQFDLLESRWRIVEDACRVVPWSLVHNDFAERNVRIRANDTRPELVAFDWEVAGWGMPPVDLAHADVTLYWSLVRDAWPTIDSETFLRLVTLGKLLRGGLAASNWCVGSLSTTWVEKSMEDLRVYHRRIHENLKSLGWVP